MGDENLKISGDADADPNPLPAASVGVPAVSPSKDAKGRFVAGNKAGKGNPLARKVQKLREAMFAAVSPADWKRIINKAKEQAEEGDPAARAFLADRLLGKAVQPVEVTQPTFVEQPTDEDRDATPPSGCIPA